MKTLYTQVFEFIDSHRSDMLAMWEDFVNTPSQARDREAAMRMAEKLTAVLEETGMTVPWKPSGVRIVPVSRCCSADIMTRSIPPRWKILSPAPTMNGTAPRISGWTAREKPMVWAVWI